MSTLRLRVISSSRQVKELPLDQLQTLVVERGATYSVIDTATQKPPAGMVLKKVGDALSVEVDGVAVAQVQHFYQDDGAAAGSQGAAAFDVGATGASGQSQLITAADAAPGSDTQLVWPTDSHSAVAQGAAADAPSMGWGWGLGLGGLAVAAAAGGGGDDNSSSPGTLGNRVAVTVTGGPVLATNDLEVDIYKADGTFLTKAALGGTGQVTLNVGGYTGVIIAKVAQDADGLADYLDEASNAGKDLNTDLFAMGFIEGSNTTLTLNVNLLSSLAFLKATESSGNPIDGGAALDVDTVNANNTAVASLFGLPSLHGIPVVTTNGDTTYNTTDGVSPSEKYGEVLAALSGMDANNGGNSQLTLDALVDGVTVTGTTAQFDNSTSAAVNQGAYTVDQATGTQTLGSIGASTNPTVVAVSIASATGAQNSTLNAGDVVSVTVVMSEPVTVTGSPKITLDIGGTFEQANYSSGTGTGTLTFTYTILTGQTDANGIAITADTLTLHGGTILAVDNSEALLLPHAGVADNAAFKVDTTAPTTTVSGIDISADTGASATDFITQTAAQTVTATLSATLATGDIVYGSVNGGSTWTNVTGFVTGTALSWPGVTLAGSSSLQFKVTDAAGNDGTIATQAYVLDTTAPTTTVSGIDISADTGTSATDFITQTAAQTVTATLSTTLATGDIVYGSVDGGSTWTDVTSFVSGTALSWTGVTLAGSSSLQFKVTDAAGNDGTVASQAYVLDTTAPTTTVSGLDISADTGASATDFITQTAAQTVTATLSASLATGDIVYGSVDGGSTWTNVTSFVSGTALSWTGVTLAGSSSLQLKVTDAAGNDGTIASQAYVLDTTAPAITVSDMDISADTGASDTDFITQTAAQIVTATLSATLATGDIVFGSVDGGSTWTNVTSFVSGTALSWTGVTLAGSSNLQIKVTDAAGNDGTVASQAYVLDTTAPTTTIATLAFSNDTGTPGDFITQNPSQTVSGTLSANLASGEVVEVSLDNGASWAAASATTGQNTWSLASQTLTGSNTLQVRVSDAAGNHGTATTQAYELDLITVSGVGISADTGVSATDFITHTAAQTVTGTLSAALTGSDTLYGSVDGGTSWIDITSFTTGTAISWTGVTLAGSSSLVFKINSGGSDGPNTGSVNYVLDTTAPTTTVSGIDISADTGTSATDFITKTAAQTVTATLSATLAPGDIVYGSVDGGTSWTNVTSFVSGTALSWTGVTLAGSSSLQIKVSDAAGNDGTVASQAYVLDTTAPTLVSSTPTDGATGISAGANVVLTFSENMVAGSGNVVISDGAADTRTIAVGDAQVTISNASVTINPTADLADTADYHLTIASGVLTDVAGNAYTGLTAATDLNFTTASPAPVYDHFIVAKGSTAGGSNGAGVHAWVDVNEDGQLTAADQTGGAYSLATFGATGNTDLSTLAATITYWDIPTDPNELDFSGFGADDKILIDVANFYANANFDIAIYNGLKNGMQANATGPSGSGVVQSGPFAVGTIAGNISFNTATLRVSLGHTLTFGAYQGASGKLVVYDRQGGTGYNDATLAVGMQGAATGSGFVIPTYRFDGMVHPVDLIHPVA